MGIIIITIIIINYYLRMSNVVWHLSGSALKRLTYFRALFVVKSGYIFMEHTSFLSSDCA